MPTAGHAFLRRIVTGIYEVLRPGSASALFISHRGAASVVVSDKESWYKTVTVSPVKVCGYELMLCIAC